MCGITQGSDVFGIEHDLYIHALVRVFLFQNFLFTPKETDAVTSIKYSR